MRPTSFFHFLATHAMLPLLCLALAVGNVSRARQLLAGSFGGSGGAIFEATQLAGNRLPSQEELPTEAPASSEFSQTGESASLAEARRVLRRFFGIGPFVSKTTRTSLALTATRRVLEIAAFENAFRNGLGAPIRC